MSPSSRNCSSRLPLRTALASSPSPRRATQLWQSCHGPISFTKGALHQRLQFREVSQESSRVLAVHDVPKDYAISPDLFHWESQNATSTRSQAGDRYLHHERRGSRVVLFLRQTPENEIGAAPFLCVGQASYLEHRGEKSPSPLAPPPPAAG
ncbi:MAG: DUF3427 domain-containing protein [Cryobacterium sp.]|nr:DUF3427 domain-containing protein [Cryobacterium sp.]